MRLDYISNKITSEDREYSRLTLTDSRGITKSNNVTMRVGGQRIPYHMDEDGVYWEACDYLTWWRSPDGMFFLMDFPYCIWRRVSLPIDAVIEVGRRDRILDPWLEKYHPDKGEIKKRIERYDNNALRTSEARTNALRTSEARTNLYKIYEIDILGTELWINLHHFIDRTPKVEYHQYHLNEAGEYYKLIDNTWTGIPVPTEGYCKASEDDRVLDPWIEKYWPVKYQGKTQKEIAEIGQNSYNINK